jgi:hypothetical protein
MNFPCAVSAVLFARIFSSRNSLQRRAMSGMIAPRKKKCQQSSARASLGGVGPAERMQKKR